MNEIAAKVIFIGDTRVGKTSIINKFARKNESTLPTIGANSICVSVPLEDGDVELSIWDTAGQEEFKCLVPMYARGAQVAVIVFDLSSEASYKGIDSWIKSVKEEYLIPSVIVVGNKSDLDTFADPCEIFIEYKGEQLNYIHASAATGDGIDSLFSLIAIETKKVYEFSKKSDTVELQEETPKKGCC